MSDRGDIRVRRLDGRNTHVNLETLDYFDLSVVPVEGGDPWVMSEVWINRLYIHPDFRFVAQISHVQYHGPRPGDTFVHPLAKQLVVDVRASEISPMSEDPSKECACLEIGEAAPRPKEDAKTGAFGLVFDESRIEIKRNGLIESIHVNGRISWEVLCVLDAKQGTFASVNDFDAAWQKCERDVPSIGNLYKKITEVRKLLTPIGLTIENAPNTGWRLVKLESDHRKTELRSKGKRR